MSRQASSAKRPATKRPSTTSNASVSRQTSVKINGPTALTILRMFLAIIFFVLILINHPATHILALIIFVVASITDLIDGKWARKHQKVTDLGAFLDPLADKMLTSLAFLAFITMGLVPVWVFAVILIRDFAIDGMRMMAAREGVTIAASKCGKWKTTFQLTALIILLVSVVASDLLPYHADFVLGNPLAFGLFVCGSVVLYVALALTIISGLNYLIKNWHKVIKDDII